MKRIVLFLTLASLALAASVTKIGGSGTTKVGGSGTTKVNAVVVPVAITSAGKSADGTSGATATITVSPSAGSLLVVVMANYNSSSSHVNHAVTDNQTSTWVKVTGINDIGVLRASLWYLKNCGAGITTITLNSGASGQYVSGVCHEITGCSATAPFTTGEFVAVDSNGTNPQTGTLTFASANSIIFAGTAGDAGDLTAINATGTTGTWAYYSTASHNTTPGEFLSVPYVFSSASGTTGHGWTGSNEHHPVVAAAFHP